MSGRSVEIQGLNRLVDRFRTLDFLGRGARDFLRDWSDQVRDNAVRNAPRFRGDLARSIETELEGNGRIPTGARVYSDDPKARWLDLGTGLLSEDPHSARRAYFPPPDRLRDWATGHGLDPYLVARGIFMRGGTPPTHFFTDAVEEANRNLSRGLARFGKDIEYDAGH